MAVAFELEPYRGPELKEVPRLLPSEDYAWMLGVLAEGGTVNQENGQIKVKSPSMHFRKAFASIGERLFGIECKEYPSAHEAKEAVFSSKKIAREIGNFHHNEWFRTIEETHSWIESDPKYIWKFLEGFLERNSRISLPLREMYFDTSFEGAKYIQKLLLSIGINRSKPKKEGVKISNIEDMKKIAKNVHLVTPEKEEKLDAIRSCSIEPRPINITFDKVLEEWDNLIILHGKIPTINDIRQARRNKKTKYSTRTYIDRFGNFSKASEKLTQLVIQKAFETVKRIDNETIREQDESLDLSNDRDFVTHLVNQRTLLTREQEIDLAKSLEALRAMRKALEPNGNSKKEKGEIFTGATLYERVNMAYGKGEEIFIQANQGLVAKNAFRYIGGGLSLKELISEGNNGLTKAVAGFDWRRGCKFSTYATPKIRQAINRALDDQAEAIRIPVHIQEKRRKLKRDIILLTLKLGREPNKEEIADDQDMDTETLDKYLSLPKTESLEEPIGDDGDLTLGSTIRDDGLDIQEEAIDQASKQEARAKALEALERLSPREKKLMGLRYGFFDGRARTLSEVGEEFGISRERVRQIEAEALRKLKEPENIGKMQEVRACLTGEIYSAS